MALTSKGKSSRVYVGRRAWALVMDACKLAVAWEEAGVGL